jgi:serine protease AprX
MGRPTIERGRVRDVMRYRTVAGAVILAGLAAPVFAATVAEKVDRALLDRAPADPVEFLVVLSEQADLAALPPAGGKVERRRQVVEALRRTAERTQPGVLSLLQASGAAHHAFWIANMVWARADRATIEALAGRDDVARIRANPRVRARLPTPEPLVPAAVEWNIAKVRAPDVWALGYTGQGVVVAGADTGYRWDHAALVSKYRGWSGATADHDYNWHDAIHAGGGACGFDTLSPCDDSGHGTHTMGTMVGDDGASNQVGMAPGAKWVGCRNMDVGNGTPATYAECFQFFMAPTDVSGQNPDPALAPDVINNSWTCPPSEGCAAETLRPVVENVRGAGIVVVASAGNAGPACATIEDPPAIYDASFSVGATDSNDLIAGFSSRGPVTVDSSNRLKPDVSAPGVSVRSSGSSSAGSYVVLSGTSMAGPHVAGLVALMLSAQPDLAGHVRAIEQIVRRTAVPLGSATQTCGGIPTGVVPNHVYGSGRIDALAAVNASLDWIFSDGFEP